MLQDRAFVYWGTAACGLACALILLAVLAPPAAVSQSPDVLVLRRSQALPEPVAYGPPLPLAASPPAEFQIMLAAVISTRSPADPSPITSAVQAPLPLAGSSESGPLLPGDRRRGITFSPGNAAITLRIEPTTPRQNQGQDVEISFKPGKTCNFGDGQACVYTFRSGAGIPIIYLTIHSGIGGEGQPFRHAVEGTGLNRAAYSLPQIQANLDALVGAGVVLSQGQKTRRQFKLVAVGRLPPDRMAAYIAAPVEQALPLAAAIIPDFEDYLNPKSPLIIFETCGWKVNGEPGAERASATSGSVYIGIIQEKP